MITEKSLPLPSEAEIQQSLNLENYLCHKMDENGGQLSFYDYFSECLYHPEYGYYTSALPKFGQEGDFITAPLISPYFTQCIAEHVVDVFSHLGPAPIILELGAGSGIMASDLLSCLQSKGQLPEKYYILEISDALVERQKRLLQEHHRDIYHLIEWIKEPLSVSWQGVLLANEVIDALPVERFAIKEGCAHYMDVRYRIENNYRQFITQLRDADDRLNHLVSTLRADNIVLDDGYESEFHPHLHQWLAEITKSMEKGCALLIDYGYDEKRYYHPDHHKGTLIAHYQHHVHDNPYIYVGIQDLTANVNFTALAHAALSNHLDVIGFTAQTYFLYDCGLETFLINDQDKLTEIEWFKVAQSIQQLVSPFEMGERFKVMALGRGISETLLGFRLKDLTHTL